MNRRVTVGVAIALVAITCITATTVAPWSLTGVVSGDGGTMQSVSDGESSYQPASNTSATQEEPPSTLSIDAPPNRTVIDDEVVRLEADGASDADVSYEWAQTSGPDVALIADETATPWLVIPELHSTHTLTFEVVVSNGQATDTATTNVTVEPNEEPTATIGGTYHVTEDDSFLVNGTASSDPDGESLQYEWVQTAGPEAEMGRTDEDQLAVTAPRVREPTTISFQLSVVDSHGEQDTETREVTVYPDPDQTHGEASTDAGLVNNDQSMNLTQRGLTHYQVDLVAGEPLAEFGAADSDRFYSDQERLVQWLWGATDDRVTNRGRPLTLDEETDSCVDSENIDIDGEAATVDVTIADGCAVELSLVTYVKSEPGFDRETASEQELYDTTTATVGPGQYTFTVAVPDSE